MAGLNVIRISLLFFTLGVCGGCEEESFPKQDDFENKIVGKWKQVESFDLVDSTVNPSSWDWFEREDGFILELAEDSNFVYTKYGSCVTGRYSFNPNSLEVVFAFDCEIAFKGESFDILVESFDSSTLPNDQLFMVHADSDLNEKQLYSKLERIE